jgi:hypothetical protein
MSTRRSRQTFLPHMHLPFPFGSAHWETRIHGTSICPTRARKALERVHHPMDHTAIPKSSEGNSRHVMYVRLVVALS